MTQKTDDKTEKQILDAARSIFLDKGKAGARMQEIADKAGVNKALLHYYFRSKDKIYSAVLEFVFSEIVGSILQDFDASLPFDEMLKKFIRNHIKVINDNQNLFRFFFSEIWMNKEEVVPLLKKKLSIGGSPVHLVFFSCLQQAVSDKVIRPIQPVHFLINILSLNVFFFLASPLLFNIVGVPEDIQFTIQEDRADEVFDFIWRSIRYREEGDMP